MKMLYIFCFGRYGFTWKNINDMIPSADSLDFTYSNGIFNCVK